MEQMTVEQALRWMNIALKEASFICPSEDHQKCKPCARRRQALATLRAELADMREELDATIDQRDLLSQEVLRLEGKLDGLRADAERYQFIRLGRSDRHGDCYAMTFDAEGDYPLNYEKLDAAVDAARQEKGHE